MSQRNSVDVGDLVQLCLCPLKGRTGVVVDVVPPVNSHQPWQTIYKVLIDGRVQTYSKNQVAQTYVVHCLIAP